MGELFLDQVVLIIDSRTYCMSKNLVKMKKISVSILGHSAMEYYSRKKNRNNMNFFGFI